MLTILLMFVHHIPHGLALGWWHHHGIALPIPQWQVRPPIPGTYCTPNFSVCTG